jgi:16S rRNA (guanine527-N7)-methyltransferase
VRLSSALEVELAQGSEIILGRSLSADELDAFARYLGLITKWQRVHRLVGSIEPRWLVENAILDSLLFLKLLPGDVEAIADLGSGAGLPGIPLKIVRPDIRVTLIESRARRVSFLAAAIRELGLQQCRIVAERAETIGPGSYDAVVVRCAGGLAEVVPVAAGITRPGGLVIASGPPKPQTTRPHPIRSKPAEIEWVEIPGIRSIRRFAVFRKR